VTGHVFISYSHRADATYVDRLARYLSNAGVPVWFDQEIVSGSRWTSVIREQLETSAAVIVVMTPEAEQSDWVNREIAQAEATGRPIFPLLLRGNRFFTLAHLQYEDVQGAKMPDAQFVARLSARLTPVAPLPDMSPVDVVEVGPRPRVASRRRPLILTAATLAVLIGVIGGAYFVPKLVDRATGSPRTTGSSTTPTGSSTPTSIPPPSPSDSPSASPSPTGPATDFSIFKSSLLRSFATKWATAFPCQARTQSAPGFTSDGVFCNVNSDLPGVRSPASKRVLVTLDVIQPGYSPRNLVGCTSDYVIPGMDATLRDLPGTTGDQSGYYCEEVDHFVASYSGPPAGYCTIIFWTSGDYRLAGTIQSCPTFKDEGSSYRPTRAMLDYLRTLWHTYA
jgi:hypothetical protein